MNPVVHFEMPAQDRKRMADFYSAVFGWKTQLLGEEMGSYVLAQTAETDANGMVLRPGTINGGFYPKVDDSQAPHPSIVIAVDDIKASIEQISKAGGRVLGEPVMIPGVGLYASFIDTENNRSSILQPSMNG